MRTLYCANDITHNNFSFYKFVENDGVIDRRLTSDCSYEGTCGCFVCNTCMSQKKDIEDCYAICTHEREHHENFGMYINYEKLLVRFIKNHMNDDFFIAERKSFVFQMFMKLRSNEDISINFWESICDSPQ